METIVIAHSIAVTFISLLVCVLSVLYIKDTNKLKNEIAERQNLLVEIQNDVSEYMKAQQSIKDGMFKEHQKELSQKNSEISDLKNEIDAYKEVLKDRTTEIVQYKNQIEELQKDNTLLGQQLAECQVPNAFPFKDWLLIHNIKEGSYVKVLKNEGYASTPTMDKAIGKTCKVVRITDDECLILEDGLANFGYHYSNLEPVTEVPDPKELYIAKQAEWVKENNVRYGTPVKFIREYKQGENGYNPMDVECVIPIYKNIDGKVCGVYDDCIMISINDNMFYVPYFSLELNRRKRK